MPIITQTDSYVNTHFPRGGQISSSVAHRAARSTALCQRRSRAWAFAGSMAGRDDMEILVSGNRERKLLIARFDNLGKGASGAAIQNMNLRMGLNEKTGLVE